MASRQPTPLHTDKWLIDHADRRIWCVAFSFAFVLFGCLYAFVWGSVVQHHPFGWIEPPDLGSTYLAAVNLAHGNFAGIYTALTGVIVLPGMLVTLLPFSALNAVFRDSVVAISKDGHPLRHPFFLSVPHPHGVLNVSVALNHGYLLTSRPQWFVFVFPYTLLLSCLALLACDALAERLAVPRTRRVFLTATEAILLWPVAAEWGHPEDAIAVAFAVYAFVFAIDRRWARAGWLFGIGVAFQPFVLLILPILLMMAGWRAAVPMTARSLVPVAAVLAIPLAGAFASTFRALLDQQTYPNLLATHQTPWTALAPRVGGQGKKLVVAGGPIRLIAIAAAIGFAGWARRWRQRPEMLAWCCAVGVALWCYTESVMVAYYIWPALAVGVVVAAHANRWQFAGAIALGVLTTVVAEWQLAWLPWWLLVIGGITLLLVTTARLAPLVETQVVPEPGRLATWADEHADRQRAATRRPVARSSVSAARKRKKTARSSRRRNVRR